jgi:SagB-type dehydrogenase family enzyme
MRAESVYMKIGDKFHLETKYIRDKIKELPNWAIQPDQYKTYPKSKKIILRKPVFSIDYKLDDAFRERSSIRNFSNEKITMDQLSYLLWSSTGLRQIMNGFKYRTAPSAGALYPIETYLIVNNVEEIKQGVYHYNINNHYLETIKIGDFRLIVAKSALDQEMCYESAVVFIWTAIFNRSKCKYGERAYRYIYLEAGHIAENLALAAMSIKLGSCQIAAFYDDEVNQIIDVNGIYESTIYLSVLGYRK